MLNSDAVSQDLCYVDPVAVMPPLVSVEAHRIHIDDVIRVVPPVAEIRLYANGGVVLFDGSRPIWLKTSNTGKWIYEHVLSRRGSCRTLVGDTAERYEVPPEMIERDIIRFVGALVDADLAKVEGDRNPNPETKATAQYGNDHLQSCRPACIYLRLASNGHSDYATMMSTASALRIVDQVAEISPRVLAFSGGHSFLHPGLIDIVRYARHRCSWQLRVLVPGTGADEHVLEEISTLVDEIRVWFAGTSASTHDAMWGRGAFDRALSTMRWLAALNRPALRGIAFTPTQDNLTEIGNLFIFALKIQAQDIKINPPCLAPGVGESHQCLDVDSFYTRYMEAYDTLVRETAQNILPSLAEYENPPTFNPVIDPARQLLVAIRRTSCGAGATTLLINQSGDVYPCEALSLASCKLGNAYETPLNKIYAGPAKQFRAQISCENIPQCAACSYRFLCAGGCRARAEAPFSPVKTCAFVRERCERFLRNLAVPRVQNKQGCYREIEPQELLCEL